MVKRVIIRIDEEKCNGCGLCIPGCAEGALQIIDGKARLVREALCDGLGACLGECPQGALYLEEAEVEAFDPELVTALHSEKQVKARGTVQEETEPAAGGFEGGCPGLRSFSLGSAQVERKQTTFAEDVGDGQAVPQPELRNWPVQLALISPKASFLKGAHLLLCADCVPFAFAGFHQELLQGRVAAVACPKLDDAGQHVEKLAAILRANDIAGITVARMEVPCCGGLVRMAEIASAMAGVTLPISDIVITIGGEAQARKTPDTGR